MKKLLSLAFLFCVLISCNSDDQDDEPVTLEGQWRLIAMYADPGDGSGSFVDVNSNKTITFEANNTVVSNGNLCQLDPSADTPSNGTYDPLDQSLSIPGCFQDPDFSLRTSYEIINNRLIISYPCIEGCQEKYRKVD